MTSMQRCRRRSFFTLIGTGLLAAIFLGDSLGGETWPPPQGLPMTRWAGDVSPDRPVLPEYPRPQLVRRAWLSLNGPWDYAIAPREAASPGPYQGKILVPFPPQAVLSQVNKPVDGKQCVWYHRTMEIPAGWAGKHVLLHFGAINWQSRIEVNGKEVGTHTGGYDGFACDITAALRPRGPQDLVVWAWNPVEGGQPHGKQSLKPAGITYTPTTGIWQTVWIEPVAASHIEELRIVPDVDRSRLELTVNVCGAFRGRPSRPSPWIQARRLAQHRQYPGRRSPCQSPTRSFGGRRRLSSTTSR